jgi:hypothetical protein
VANLISPGVSVSVTDESYYDSSTPGSIPLIVIATASNKVSPTGSGLATFTLNENAGKLFVATSQRELIQNFGNPLFYSSGGSSLHGHELNEYGLHAAYQFLGLASRAYVLRADVDTAQLVPSDSAPKGEALGGTFWFNPAESAFGVFKSNGKSVPGEAWVSQPVTAFYSGQTSLVGDVATPLATLGANGDFGVVVHTSNNFLFEKLEGAWHQVGSASWKAASDTVVVGTATNPTVTIGNSISINGVTVAFTGTTLSSAVADINGSGIPNIDASVKNGALMIANTAGTDLTLDNVAGVPLTTFGIANGTTKGNNYTISNSVQYPSGSVAGDVWVKGSATNRGATWSVKVYSAVAGLWQEVSAPFFAFDSTLIDGNPAKDSAIALAFGNSLVEGQIYVGYDAATGAMELRRYGLAGFETLSYEATSVAPSSDPVEGTLWFSNDFRADIMVSDGERWLGYHNAFADTNPKGVFLTGTAPRVQSDGTPLVQNDLWIDTSNLEEYPLLYRFDATSQRWKLIDVTDQTSPFGVMFADGRQDSGKQVNGNTHAEDSTATADMLVSDFVDPDAPDPRSVPAGMLLFNTRYASFNVKRWEPNHFTFGGYDANVDYTTDAYTVGDAAVVFPALSNAGRWVTASGNRADGSPLMGRRAQRAVIVKAMAEAINRSEDARSEIVAFNLIAAPGYPELIDEMVNLNTDQGEVSFVVGDTPARLAPDANSVTAWANNSFGASSNGEDGLVTSNPYVGVYYPWGLSSNIDGQDVMVPPSTMALRTMAYNDQVAYPWFAPAGFQRGLVTNASTVGYLTPEDEFRSVLLSPGQRDNLYALRINPIALVPNRGLIIYGQKTRAPVSTALDRVNVARLVNYLRTSLDLIMKPFLFEQNDEQTRDSAQLTVDRFLNGIVGLRGLTDYAVQCNTDNNTAERIDRNELWVDIAIKPVKSVEFIYVPIRITNTGADLTAFGERGR